MNIKELTKDIIDTITFNEINTDTSDTIDFICDIVTALLSKDIETINDYVFKGLLTNYRDTNDNSERDAIENTFKNIVQYLAN